MKKHSTFTVRLLALALALGLACVPALAEEQSSMSALFAAARTLAFDTTNVTMDASASFSIDGQVFKDVTVRKQQTETGDKQEVSIHTPADGVHEIEERTGGYTLWSQDSSAYVYSIDTAHPEYYMENGAPDASRTLLRATSSRRTLFDLAAVVAEGLNDRLTVEGQTVSFTMNDGESAPLADALLSYVAALQQQRMGYSGVPDTASSCSIRYEDWNESFRAWCEKNGLLNKELIDAYMDGSATSEQNAEFWTAGDAYYDAFRKEAETHLSGVLRVKADATTEWYESENAYYLATGILDLSCEDYRASLRDYYNEQNSKTLDEDAFNKYCDELPMEAYNAMSSGFHAYWTEKARAQDEQAVAAILKTDGTLLVFNNLADLQNRQLSQYQLILGSLSGVKLTAAKCAAELDAAGRFTSITGAVTLTLVYQDGSEHLLVAEFTVELSDYGTTSFEAFDAEKLGLMSFSEYYGY